MDFLRTLCARNTDKTLMLDIGSNVGGMCHSMLEHPGRITAFEPCPALAAGLRERFKDEPRVTIFQRGISDRVYIQGGLTVFNAWTLGRAGEPNKRHVSPGAIELVGKEPFEVRFTTIDDYVWIDSGGRPIDFIKLDTDGYELRALRGGVKTIQKDRPNILIELGEPLLDIGDKAEDILAMIHDTLSYVIYDESGAKMPYAQWRDWYPFNTTKDFAMVPAERGLYPK